MLHSCRDHGKSDANIPIHTGAPGQQQDGFPPPHHQRQGDPVSSRVRDSLLDQENIRPLPAVPPLQQHQQPLLHPAQGTTVQCSSVLQCAVLRGTGVSSIGKYSGLFGHFRRYLLEDTSTLVCCDLLRLDMSVSSSSWLLLYRLV